MKRLLAFVLALVLAVSFTAVINAEETKTDKKIGILAPAVTHGWVAAVAYNAEKRAAELNLNYKIATSKNAEEMTAQLSDMLTWGAEAIVIFPQWSGMEEPIKEVIEQGVKVVNFDIDIKVDNIYKITGDNKDMGVQGAKCIAEKLANKGKVIVLEVPSSGSVSELRKEGFVTTLKEIAPEIELSFYATQFTREDGLKDMADILTKMEHIDAVFSMDDETSIGALQAIEEAKRTDIKLITGGGGMQEYFNLMPKYENIDLLSALYSPSMVKKAVDMANDLLLGKEVEHLIVVPTTIVDRNNYKDYLDADSPY